MDPNGYTKQLCSLSFFNLLEHLIKVPWKILKGQWRATDSLVFSLRNSFYSLLSINFLPCSSMFIHFLAGPTHQPQILFSFAVLSFFFPLPFASWDAAFFAFPGLQQRWQDDRAGNTGVSCVCVSWTLREVMWSQRVTMEYNGGYFHACIFMHMFQCFSTIPLTCLGLVSRLSSCLRFVLLSSG